MATETEERTIDLEKNVTYPFVLKDEEGNEIAGFVKFDGEGIGVEFPKRSGWTCANAYTEIREGKVSVHAYVEADEDGGKHVGGTILIPNVEGYLDRFDDGGEE